MPGSDVPYVMKVAGDIVNIPGGTTVIRALGKYGGCVGQKSLSRGAISARFGITPGYFDEMKVLPYLESIGVVNSTPDGVYELSGIGSAVVAKIGGEFRLSLTPRGKEVADELWGMHRAIRGRHGSRK